MVFTLQKYGKQKTGKYRRKGLFPYFLSKPSVTTEKYTEIPCLDFLLGLPSFYARKKPSTFSLFGFGEEENNYFINYFIAAGLPWVHTLNDFGVMDMPHYNFCGTVSNLRKDMFTTIKEVLIIKGVREIKFGGNNTTLIRELNGLEQEKVIVTDIKLQDGKVLYKGKNPNVEEAFGKDDYWYELDNELESYVTCDCSIYEEVYNVLKNK